MWAVLGADQGEKWPWLEREGDLGRDLGRKVAQTRVGARSARTKLPILPNVPRPPTHFSMDIYPLGSGLYARDLFFP